MLPSRMEGEVVQKAGVSMSVHLFTLISEDD